MLSIKQYSIIEEQISKDNAKEFIDVLLSKYADSAERISDLMQYIPKLAERQLQIMQKRINQYSWGMDLIIADRNLYPRKYKKSDKRGRFVMLFFACKAHFIFGNSEHHSIAKKSFFSEFVEMLKEKEEFDYTNPEDWEWVYNAAGGAGWLESVIRQNIDGEFVKPKNKNVTCRIEIW